MTRRIWFPVALLLAVAALVLLRSPSDSSNSLSPVIDEGGSVAPEPASDDSGTAAPVLVPAVPTIAETTGTVPVPRMPLSPNMNHIPRLLAASEWFAMEKLARSGDRLALEDLYQDLMKCKGVPASDAAMQSAMERLQADAEESESAKQTLGRFQQERYARCQTIPSQVRNAFETELYALRAELGGVDEKLDYLQRGMPDPDSANYPEDRDAYETRARGFLDGMIASHNSRALQAMSTSYLRGLAHPRDISRAYVYACAYGLTQANLDEATAQRISVLEHRLVSGTVPALQQEAARVAACCL